MSFIDSDGGRADGQDTGRTLPPDPQPGSPSNPVPITDPRALRALAHPARLEILQHLALDGPATATECAEVVGLSPSACSYHLRALARYGFVEEERAGAADQRHRPWRARLVAISVGEDPDRPAAARAAGRLLYETLQARIDELRADYMDREAEYPREWQGAVGTYQDVLHLTPNELTEIRAKIAAILSEYRRLSPDDQPAGARRVHALVEFLPWFKPESRQS
jgi:DNA-binding transcriptional ArsR family regulator